MDLFKNTKQTIQPGAKLTVSDPTVVERFKTFETGRLELGKRLRELEIADARLAEQACVVEKDLRVIKGQHEGVENEINYIKITMARNGMEFWNAVANVEPLYTMNQSWSVVREESSEAGIVILRETNQDEMMRDAIMEAFKARNGERKVGFSNKKGE